MSQLNLEQVLDLAVQHHQAGQLAEAENLYRQILAVQPDHADALHYLGLIAGQRGQDVLATNLIRQAIALKPNSPDALNNLGFALRGQGKLDEAIAAFRQALALQPGYTQAQNNLNDVLKVKENISETIAPYLKAVALNSNHSQVLYNLCKALQDKGALAIAAYRDLITVKPDLPEAWCGLGTALGNKGQLDEAIAAYRQAITLRPGYPEAHHNLGIALGDKGQLDEALATFRQAVVLKPDHPYLHSCLIFALHYHPAVDARTIAEEHRRWNSRHAEPLKPHIQPHSNNRNPDRRLRIGYVSPDFLEHPVARFLVPLLSQRNKSQVEVFAYDQVSAHDAMTQRLRTLSDGWRDIVGLSDAETAELIRQDRIDILVDLAGHTGNNRLLVFARKPAPIQVTWLGYPNTTGLSTMDYRLTDASADPPGMNDALYTEQLVRLPQTAWCFDRPRTTPVSPKEDGTAITFASFNNFAKVTDAMLRTWARILHALPEARLLLKARSLSNVTVQHRVWKILDAAGVAPDRVKMLEWQTTYEEHLEAYAPVDIALDTFPYHGTTTTCEALWMGVPVITLAGQTHVSRVGVSLLSNVGLAELVAQDFDDYLRIALNLATDRLRLAELHRNLHQRMEQSPLMDAPAFARNVEAAYRKMWRNWCATVDANA